MRTRHLLLTFAAFSPLLFTSRPLFAAIQLTQIVSGLTSPVFVGNAGDGTNRLFIVERQGFIRVLQPGSSTPTLFLNISPLVLSGLSFDGRIR